MSIHQFTAAQDWALSALAGTRTPSVQAHTRTLRCLERAGLVARDSQGWRLTPAGRREAVNALERLSRRRL